MPDSVATLYDRMSEFAAHDAAPVGGHLAYVEPLLRMRSTRHLDAAQSEMRELLLDLLLLYNSTATVPSGTVLKAANRPCFVGKQGELCPVGFLLARTAGFEFASQVCGCEDLQQLHPDVLARLEAWMLASGISADEFNIIQPGFAAAATAPAQKLSSKGVHPRFERLKKASQYRLVDYLARAFVGTRNLLHLHERDASHALQNIRSITLAGVFGPVGELAQPNTTGGSDPNQEMTFSRTF